MGIPIFFNTVVFIFLSLLHVYWACGGKWGYGAVLPTDKDGQAKMAPGVFATLVVAAGLMLFAGITLGNLGYWNNLVAQKYFTYGTLLIAIIFLLRAVGDFKYIGFFKKTKDTPFASNDSKIYSPLCLLISCISFIIICCR